MKAIATTPLMKDSYSLIETDKLIINENEVLVKVIQAGVCRTDLEIIRGLYGEAPQGYDYLIMGHESIGEVVNKGNKVTSLEIGDLVVRTVRRPCYEGCLNCRNDQNDMCLTGNYTEVGIKGIHGIMSEYYNEEPHWLIKVPKRHKDVGVLLEPLSFVEKVIRQITKAQERMYWDLQSAAVFGSGPIGILTAMTLRSMGVETVVLAKSHYGNVKSRLVEETGASYFSTQEHKINELVREIGKRDLVVEATGDSQMILEGLKFLNTNGVLSLTSITGDCQPASVDISKINLDLVLKNNLIVGVVNANRQDYLKGVKRFDDFENNWPGLTPKLLTRQTGLADYKDAFKKTSDDIKSVIEF